MYFALVKKRVPAALMLAGLCACGNQRERASTKAPTPVIAPEAHRDNYIEEANVVEISLEAQRRAGIAVAPLTMGAVEARVVLTGTVQPMDSRVSELRPLARGRLTAIHVKAGDRVAAGEVVAEFDNIEVSEITAQYNVGLADLRRIQVQQANAKRQAERKRELANAGAVSNREAENLEADALALAESAHAQQATLDGLSARLNRFGAQAGGDANQLTKVRAPFAGVVIRVNAAPGAVIDTTTPLLSVADLSRVYVEAQVFEKDLRRVHPGQMTQVRFEAFPGEMFQGRVASIRDILDPQTRTAGVRVELPNPAGRLRLEMFAEIELPTVETHMGLRVPSEAVQTANRRTIVFVKQDALHFAAREVMTADDGLMTEIVSGLKEGELVVTNGAYQLKSIFVSRQIQTEHEH